MQTGYTGHVVRSEWWWTTLISLTFILFTFSPFMIIALTNPAQSDVQFMGVLHDYIDSAAHLSRIQQGVDGDILVDFLYTAESQDTALVHPIYSLLGQLQRSIALSPTILFHMIRIFVSLFMFLAIYYLGASIWIKIRTRRIFFVLASVGAGFGWFVALFIGMEAGMIIPDLNLPQAFPIHASAANIHYPLAISCIALLVAEMISILRPGETMKPRPDNGGALVFIVSLILALVYPDALLPLGIAYTVNVLINWLLQREITVREWYWGLWILVPALPIVAYNLLIVINNPYVASWLQQRGGNTPNILMLMMSLGLVLLIALPGIFRAIRRFEADGDRFMLIWLLSMLLTTYLPLQLDQYLLMALLIPVAYFATRSIEDFWFTYIRRLHRPKAYILIIPFLVLSHILWVFLPIYPLLTDNWLSLSNTIIEEEYSVAFIRFYDQLDENTVTLASPSVGLWIPAWTGTHTVYGHPTETFAAEETRLNVLSWYQQSDSAAEECQQFVDEHRIQYVIYGPRERDYGSGACKENLMLAWAFQGVTIYSTQYASTTPQ